MFSQCRFSTLHRKQTAHYVHQGTCSLSIPQHHGTKIMDSSTAYCPTYERTNVINGAQTHMPTSSKTTMYHHHITHHDPIWQHRTKPGPKTG